MKILIACDKFKGSMTASQANEAIAQGLSEGSPIEPEVRKVPMADGGEGIAHALTTAFDGQWHRLEVTDPLGTPVEAGYGYIPNRNLAVIEMAMASGLWILGDRPNDPWIASTYGTGELILNAIEKGCESIILGIGGSATNDGGTGMASALGYRFLDSADQPVTVPASISDAIEIESPALSLPDLVVACDVTNPLLGENGATRVYGPQKGVKLSEFERHEERFRNLIELVEDGSNIANEPGSGAAGGLGFGCRAFLNGRLESGFKIVAEALDLEHEIRRADLVITGEGRIDAQSDQGKAPTEVAHLARKWNKPVAAFCGISECSDLENSTFDRIWEIDKGDLPLSESISRGEELLRETAQKFRSELFGLCQ